MAHSRESIIGAGSMKNWHEFSNMPITRGDKVWYVHVLPSVTRSGKKAELSGVPKPKNAVLLRTKQEVPVTVSGDKIVLDIPEVSREYMDDVVALYWDVEPKK